VPERQQFGQPAERPGGVVMVVVVLVARGSWRVARVLGWVVMVVIMIVGVIMVMIVGMIVVVGVAVRVLAHRGTSLRAG
jgi:hypothetical protein